jgi:hypothetical protein
VRNLSGFPRTKELFDSRHQVIAIDVGNDKVIPFYCNLLRVQRTISILSKLQRVIILEKTDYFMYFLCKTFWIQPASIDYNFYTLFVDEFQRLYKSVECSRNIAFMLTPGPGFRVVGKIDLYN